MDKLTQQRLGMLLDWASRQPIPLGVAPTDLSPGWAWCVGHGDGTPCWYANSPLAALELAYRALTSIPEADSDLV